jgi:hypothetical protein
VLLVVVELFLLCKERKLSSERLGDVSMDTQLNNSRTRVGIQSLFQSLYSFPQHQATSTKEGNVAFYEEAKESSG